MRLIEEIISVDGTTLTIRTTSHSRKPHPLARDGRVGMAAVVEYAAQAAAGAAIIAGQRWAGAYLAAVDDVVLAPGDLSLVAGPITLTVTVAGCSAMAARYAFHAVAAGRELARGQLLLARRDAPA